MNSFARAMSRILLIGIAILSLLFDVSRVSAAELNAKKYATLLTEIAGQEVSQDDASVAFLRMPRPEVFEFVTFTKDLLKSPAVAAERNAQVVRAFEMLRQRSDFDRLMALAMSAALEVAAKPVEPTMLSSRLALFIAAKAGLLTPERIETELKAINAKTQPGAVRLVRVAALADAMSGAGLSPTMSQLETLLKNEDFELRMHAVDWFRMSPPAAMTDRHRFLKLAIQSKPVQVRERAYRAIASWPAADIEALPVGLVPKACATDASEAIRSACATIQSKMPVKIGSKPEAR